MSSSGPTRTGNRSVIYPGALATFPDPLGEVRIKYDHDSMVWVEEALEDELDKLNGRVLKGVGPIDDHTGEPVEFPYDSVWDALGVLSVRRLAQVNGVLAIAGLAHRHDGTIDERISGARAEIGQLPPSWWRSDEIADALNRALRTAFGEDVDPLDREDREEDALPPPPAPPVDGGASGSAGTISSPSGPPPSR